jgi:hypothetical protein
MLPQIITNPNNHPTIALNSFNSSDLPFSRTILECAFPTPLNPPTTTLWVPSEPLSTKPSSHGVPSRSTDEHCSRSSFFQHESDFADSTRLSQKLHQTLDAQTNDWVISLSVRSPFQIRLAISSRPHVSPSPENLRFVRFPPDTVRDA